jgi:hypothetical protein
MAEKVDILMPKYSDCPYYTVNTGLLSVASSPVSPANQIPFYIEGAAALIGKFQQKDNIRLLTCGFYIPEAYTLADTVKNPISLAGNELQITIYDSTVAPVVALPGLGPRGVVGIPFSNYELALDIYCDMTSVTLQADNYFYLYGQIYANDLSMVGVPAALNGSKPRIIPFIKILHTLDIIA